MLPQFKQIEKSLIIANDINNNQTEVQSTFRNGFSRMTYVRLWSTGARTGFNIF